jgi:hydrogenase small subunit
MSISRREAIKRFYNVVMAVGAASFLSLDDLLASEIDGQNIYNKPNILWLHASSCSGCSTSFLNVEDVPLTDILTRFSNILFHPDISSATGDDVLNILNTAATKLRNNYILVIEGSVPVGLPHACLMGDKPMIEWVDMLARNATAVVSAGTCAAFGGITDMDGMLNGAVSIEEFMKKENINKPIVNLPNCPMKPEHLVYTLLHYGRLGTLPKLDSSFRPEKFYARTIHERCIFYSDFQEKTFARYIGDRGCLFKLGCQGPVTKNDCLINGHNGNTNICIKAGHPCIGCSSEHFPRQIMFHSYNDTRNIKNFRVIG